MYLSAVLGEKGTANGIPKCSASISCIYPEGIISQRMVGMGPLCVIRTSGRGSNYP